MKLKLALDSDTHAALNDYAAICKAAYGQEERAETLAAAMIEAFLSSDAGFRRARKALRDTA